MIVSSGTYINFYKPVPVPLKTNFSNFPHIIEGWVGEDIDPVYDLVDFKQSGVTSELSRAYTNEEDKEVLLYIGYFEYQSQAKELINYKMNPLVANSTPLEMDFRNYKLNAVNIYREQGSSIVLYWFDVNGRKTNNQYLAKAYLMWNSMIDSKSNSAIIMVRTNTLRNEDPREYFQLCRKFINTVVPILPEFLPAND
jgi:EpsI family protein